MAGADNARAMDLVLHIGSGKTGTSSIQSLLHHNREALLSHGVLFPRSLGRRRHLQFGLYFKSDEALLRARPYIENGYRTPEAFRRGFRRRLFTELEAARPRQVLISDEAVYSADVASLGRLRTFTDEHARRLRVVCYLRRQDDHLVSRYQEVVKVGETRTLAQRVAELDMTSTYDYAARLDAWSRIVAPGTFVVRRFEKTSFREGSLYADFLAASGIDITATDLEAVPPQNESLDAESVEFLRLLNIHRVREEGAEVGMVNNRALVVRLARAATGPTLTLPESELDSFMCRWEESNREVARRYFGDEDGVLFRTPRKNRDTTAEQRLDPSRLDHLLTVTELPEELHAPMRRLLAQESR